MTKRKKNRSSAATAYLALVAAGVITVNGVVKEQMTNQSKTLMVIAVIVLIIYIAKIRGRR